MNFYKKKILTGDNEPRKTMFWLYQDIHWGTSALHWETISDELPEVFDFTKFYYIVKIK